MPKLIPGENRGQFVSRCMGDEASVAEFPDEEQRAAVCHAIYDKGAGKDARMSEEAGHLLEAAEAVTEADLATVTKAMGHRTAMVRTEPSVPLRLYQEQGLLKGDVLDYGSGQDVHEFARWDPHFAPDPAPLRRLYDTVLLNYVLNVVPLDAVRSQVLTAVRGLLKPGGQLLAAVWQKTDQDVQTSTSFQSGRTAAEWEEFFVANGWAPERLPGGVAAWRMVPQLDDQLDEADHAKRKKRMSEAAKSTTSAGAGLPEIREDIAYVSVEDAGSDLEVLARKLSSWARGSRSSPGPRAR